MRNVLVIDSHPDPQSLTARLAASYAEGAGEAPVPLLLRDLDFDLTLRTGYRTPQVLEPDLVRAQELLAWADHVAVFTPLWWGSVPALLKPSLAAARARAHARSSCAAGASVSACGAGAGAGSGVGCCSACSSRVRSSSGLWAFSCSRSSGSSGAGASTRSRSPRASNRMPRVWHLSMIFLAAAST